MDFKFKRGRDKFKLEVYECDFFKRFSGLMFIRKENAKALLFDFKKEGKISLHSFFVFFSFVVVWIDKKNNVVDLRVVKPWKFYVNTKKNFSKILEIPINRKYKEIIKELVLKKEVN